jgi:hypothetical protein
MRQQIPAALANGWPAESADTRIRAVDRERHRDFGTCSTLGDRGLNVSRFCSPELEAKLKHATALQAEDQVAAAKLWAEVDRETTNLAELIPTYTPRNMSSCRSTSVITNTIRCPACCSTSSGSGERVSSDEEAPSVFRSRGPSCA